MSTSVAAKEAFSWLNAATRLTYKGWGDTRTAARDRAAKAAGVTRAQAERLWKNWQTMKTVNGDVYRLLRNKYEHLCELNEAAADAYEAERQQLRAERHATTSGKPAPAGVEKSAAQDRAA